MKHILLLLAVLSLNFWGSVNAQEPLISEFQVEVNEEDNTITVHWQVGTTDIDALWLVATMSGGQLLIEPLPPYESGSFTFAGRTPLSTTQHNALLRLESGEHIYEAEALIEQTTHPAPYFVSFDTPQFTVDALPTKIAVTWALANRSDNTNLRFVQVLPDGSTINAELPRDVPYVSSSGDGIMALTAVGQPYTYVQVQLIDLATDQILTTKTRLINIFPQPQVTETPISGGQLAQVKIFSVEVDEQAQTTSVDWEIEATGIEELWLIVYGSGGRLIIEPLPAELSGHYVLTGMIPEYDEATLRIHIDSQTYVAHANINRVTSRTGIPVVNDFNIVFSEDGGATIRWNVTGNYDQLSLEWTGNNANTFSIGVTGDFLEMSASDVVDYYGLSSGIMLTLNVYDADGNIRDSAHLTVP